MSISTSPPKRKVQEDKIEAIINKGGSTTKEAIEISSENVTKSIKLIMTADEMETIKRLRDKRPHPSRSRKITISVHDWVIEAVQEKIERERRKYSAQ